MFLLKAGNITPKIFFKKDLQTPEISYNNRKKETQLLRRSRYLFTQSLSRPIKNHQVSLDHLLSTNKDTLNNYSIAAYSFRL